MKRTLLRAKIHRIGVTECDLDYEGSLTLDPVLMERATLVPYERIEVYNIDNGNRFATYLIEGSRNSGECCLNGAAARLVEVGHKLILAAYADLDESEIAGHQPTVVLVGSQNRIKSVKTQETPGTRFASN